MSVLQQVGRYSRPESPHHLLHIFCGTEIFLWQKIVIEPSIALGLVRPRLKRSASHKEGPPTRRRLKGVLDERRQRVAASLNDFLGQRKRTDEGWGQKTIGSTVIEGRADK